MEQEPIEQPESEESKTFSLEQGEVEIVKTGLHDSLKRIQQRLDEERKFPIERQNTPMVDQLEKRIQEISELEAKIGA